MKPDRTHLGRGAKQEDRSSRWKLIGSASAAVVAGVGVVAAVAMGAAPIVISSAVGAVAMGAVAARRFKESRTWGFPELTLAIDLGGGMMVPLAENAQVRLGDRIVGNYRRQSLVSPVPDARLIGGLIAEEKTSKGMGKGKREFDHVVCRVPLDVVANINDGMLDLDFSVAVPVDLTPVSFIHGANQVHWRLELNVVTDGPNDRQVVPLRVVPAVSGDSGAARL